jgi:hypothetical protein
MDKVERGKMIKLIFHPAAKNLAASAATRHGGSVPHASFFYAKKSRDMKR